MDMYYMPGDTFSYNKSSRRKNTVNEGSQMAGSTIPGGKEVSNT